MVINTLCIYSDQRVVLENFAVVGIKILDLFSNCRKKVPANFLSPLLSKE